MNILDLRRSATGGILECILPAVHVLCFLPEGPSDIECSIKTANWSKGEIASSDIKSHYWTSRFIRLRQSVMHVHCSESLKVCTFASRPSVLIPLPSAENLLQDLGSWSLMIRWLCCQGYLVRIEYHSKFVLKDGATPSADCPSWQPFTLMKNVEDTWWQTCANDNDCTHVCIVCLQGTYFSLYWVHCYP